MDVYLAADVLDLHVDSFIWHRILGYDLTRRHGRGLLGARVYSQVDFPRIREAQITGACWVITTNPTRSDDTRPRTFSRNLDELLAQFALVPDDIAVVRNVAEYRAARAAGKHGAFVGIQGGNALDRDLAELDRLRGLVLRITLVHLSTSRIGTTSNPMSKAGEPLSEFGKDYVRRLNHDNVFVDLAHISRAGFWEAVEVHDKRKPFLVTHTGVDAVFPHWRNLDDDQIRAVAESGGTVGVMYHGEFLGPEKLFYSVDRVLDHLAHIVKTVGDDYASLGSDWDGAVVTPRDMPTCLELPVLVEKMLRRGWDGARIHKILGGNVLRAVEALRG